MDDSQRNAVLAIANAIHPIDASAFGNVLAAVRFRSMVAADRLLTQGDPAGAGHEYFVLSGVLRSFVTDADGREVTLAFHAGPCALTPAIARSDAGRSRVSAAALDDAAVAAFPSQSLIDCMVAHPGVQRWGDAVLRAELVRRADRELALTAAERLARFRAEHPGLETRVTQHHIASYLGVTPVTLSRLRAAGDKTPGKKNPA